MRGRLCARSDIHFTPSYTTVSVVLHKMGSRWRAFGYVSLTWGFIRGYAANASAKAGACYCGFAVCLIDDALCVGHDKIACRPEKHTCFIGGQPARLNKGTG